MRDHVILLHGLGRSHYSFLLPWWRLRREGFAPAGISYPSRTRPIEELAEIVAGRLPAADGRPMHFLTHSLGGLVVRRILRAHRPPDVGRVVMLAPPNQGSQLARRLKDQGLFRKTAGPTGQQLASHPQQLADLLGPVDFELGVIAGDRPLYPAGRLFGEPSDGTVAVEESRVEGMRDFIVVRCGHTFIMNSTEVIAQAVHFFRHGRFDRGERRDRSP